MIRRVLRQVATSTDLIERNVMIGPLCNRESWRILAVSIAAGAAIAPARADIIVTDGVEPWHICAACHSLDGISAMPRFPKLAGQRAAYIEKQVRDFREGRRTNDGGQMGASASDIDDGFLAKTAAYFASLPPPPADASLQDASSQTDGAKWRRGAALFQDGDTAAGIPPCRTCHDNVAAAEPPGPFLTSQHAPYLAKQLRDWRAGARANSAEMPMIAAKLSDQDIDGLAAFLASKPRTQTSGTTTQ